MVGQAGNIAGAEVKAGHGQGHSNAGRLGGRGAGAGAAWAWAWAWAWAALADTPRAFEGGALGAEPEAGEATAQRDLAGGGGRREHVAWVAQQQLPPVGHGRRFHLRHLDQAVGEAVPHFQRGHQRRQRVGRSNRRIAWASHRHAEHRHELLPVIIGCGGCRCGCGCGAVPPPTRLHQHGTRVQRTGRHGNTVPFSRPHRAHTWEGNEEGIRGCPSAHQEMCLAGRKGGHVEFILLYFL